ncbi:MAG: hypothetical protein K2X72_38335 [Reyranella sp.]|nr:hypothetical protein [Reyranella sp.]
MTLRFVWLSAVILMAAVPLPAAADKSLDLKAYCKQLISFYDRYGASRSENSDGARNHTLIGADIDCREGDPSKGVADMEKLLERKRFEIPPR